MLEPLDINKEFEKLQQAEIKNENEIAEVEKRISFYLNFAWILIGVGFIIGLLGVAEHFMGSDMNLNVIGDYTGGVVASMWSLAGLFVIFVAFLGQKQQILHQKMELKYNQFEVKATRKELEGQKEQMIEQNNTLKQQRFESTFFQMVNLHHQIVNSITSSPNEGTVRKGRENFRLFNDKLQRKFIEFKRVSGNRFVEIDIINRIYNDFFNEYKPQLSHYFRNLYTISKFIHSSEIVDKQRYADILRAQLSSQELYLLFYNCLSNYGKRKFKPLVEEFELLKNLPDKDLIEIRHKEEYKPSAFGDGN